MSELDSFLKDISKLEKAIGKMDKGIATLAKSMTKTSSSFNASSMGSSAGNLLANSFGLSAPAKPNDPNRRSARTAAYFGKDEDTDYYSSRNSGMGRAFKKRGMAEATFSTSDGSPLTGRDMAYNQLIADKERDRVWNKQMGVSGMGGRVARTLGYQGITRQEFSQLPISAQNNIASAMPTPQDSLNLMSGIQNAMSTFLPDVGKAMTRATGYYNATRAGGNQINRSSMIRNTFDRMNEIGGISSVGSDANVAEYLAQRGMTQSGDTNSTYQQTIRAVSQASKYMNISNEQAAQSIEGLTSGQGSGNMLRQLGIYTADLKTGKEKTQGQIFEEVAQRLTAGRRGASVEQTQASIRRGTLGSTISGLFQDETTQQMFKQYMIDRAGGKSMDLSYTGAMNKIYEGQAGSNRNPLNAQMTLNANETEALGMAQDEYIKGMEAATVVIGGLQKAAGAAAATMMGFPNALLQTLMGNSQVKGIVSGAQSVASYASKGIAGIQEAIIGGEYDTPQGAIAAGVQVAAIGAASAAGAVPAMTSVAGQMLLGMGSKVTSSGSTGTPGGGGDATGAPSVTSNMFSGLAAGSTITDTSGMAEDGLPPQASYNYTFNSYSKESGKKHNADDFAMDIGTPVRAVADGIVQKVDRTVTYNTRNKSGNRGTMSATQKNSLGMFVRIYHPGGYVSVYGHLSQINVEENQPVKKGDIIGLSGDTGNSTGPHLHLKITKSTGLNNYNDNAAVDPKTVSVAQLVGNGLSSTAAPTNSASNSMSSIMAAAQAPGSSAQNAISLLTKLSSGNASDIMSAVGSMANGLGFSLNPSATYANTYGISKNSSAGAATAIGATTSTSNTPNNVTINVQVPDTSPSEAQKFAMLVKQFLEDNTLQSNTMKA